MGDINWVCVAVIAFVVFVPTTLIVVSACMLSSKITQEEER